MRSDSTAAGMPVKVIDGHQNIESRSTRPREKTSNVVSDGLLGNENQGSSLCRIRRHNDNIQCQQWR